MGNVHLGRACALLCAYQFAILNIDCRRVAVVDFQTIFPVVPAQGEAGMTETECFLRETDVSRPPASASCKLVGIR